MQLMQQNALQKFARKYNKHFLLFKKQAIEEVNSTVKGKNSSV